MDSRFRYFIHNKRSIRRLTKHFVKAITLANYNKNRKQSSDEPIEESMMDMKCIFLLATLAWLRKFGLRDFL
jgi:hypothetical protein